MKLQVQYSSKKRNRKYALCAKCKVLLLNKQSLCNACASEKAASA
jgi:RNA polymerase subunit RPABC4/transcription elongation factor Spt4